ncbi:XdhC family protein [Sagittula salina]|uniref:XdhC family protein n=1 Tax=Sagittula salina TaxID=2820268 RepID=A0A940MTS5_9RHOB|nr:XdhC family protein [Sagittula salina]MBP0484912.1 XdhC family protein [Sagittula salina]
MSKFDIFDTIASLRTSGRPFCVATVVRTADVTSAKAGAKAAIAEDGTITGHLGGGCVTRAVRKAAQTAIRSGETAMIRVKPSSKVVDLTEDGAQVFRSGCPSGGTVDLLIEPYELPPMIALYGKTPIARAIAQHALLAGFRLACAPELGMEGTPLDVTLEDHALRPQDFVVIATQGAGDLAALKAALDSPARRVSMVASGRKATALVAKLDDPTQAQRLKAPAGLDLGGIDPHEIALSVLAEIVRWRATEARLREERNETTA